MVQCVPGALGDLVPVIDLRLYTLREKVGSLLRGLKKARARLQQDYDSTEYLQHHDSLCEEILTNTASSAVDALVAFERGYLNDMLTDDPRCYNAWSHRGWLLMQFFSTASTGHEERNQAEDPHSRASEYAITEQHVRDDPSNNSALEYRFLLIVSDVVFFSSPGERKEGDVVEDIVIGHDARTPFEKEKGKRDLIVTAQE
eukprot:g1257.t1